MILNGNCLIKQEESESGLTEQTEPEQSYDAIKFPRSELEEMNQPDRPDSETGKQSIIELNRELSSWKG